MPMPIHPTATAYFPRQLWNKVLAAGKGACDADKLTAYAEKQIGALAALQDHLAANSLEGLDSLPTQLIEACRFNVTDIANELQQSFGPDSEEMGIANRIREQLGKLEALAEPHIKTSADIMAGFINKLWEKPAEGEAKLLPEEYTCSKWTRPLEVLSSLVHIMEGVLYKM